MGSWLLTLQGKGVQGAPFSNPKWGSPLSFSQPSSAQVGGEDAVGKTEFFGGRKSLIAPAWDPNSGVGPCCAEKMLVCLGLSKTSEFS